MNQMNLEQMAQLKSDLGDTLRRGPRDNAADLYAIRKVAGDYIYSFLWAGDSITEIATQFAAWVLDAFREHARNRDIEIHDFNSDVDPTALKLTAQPDGVFMVSGPDLFPRVVTNNEVISICGYPILINTSNLADRNERFAKLLKIAKIIDESWNRGEFEPPATLQRELGRALNRSRLVAEDPDDANDFVISISVGRDDRVRIAHLDGGIIGPRSWILDTGRSAAIPIHATNRQIVIEYRELTKVNITTDVFDGPADDATQNAIVDRMNKILETDAAKDAAKAWEPKEPTRIDEIDDEIRERMKADRAAAEEMQRVASIGVPKDWPKAEPPDYVFENPVLESIKTEPNGFSVEITADSIVEYVGFGTDKIAGQDARFCDECKRWFVGPAKIDARNTFCGEGCQSLFMATEPGPAVVARPKQSVGDQTREYVNAISIPDGWRRLDCLELIKLNDKSWSSATDQFDWVTQHDVGEKADRRLVVIREIETSPIADPEETKSINEKKISDALGDQKPEPVEIVVCRECGKGFPAATSFVVCPPRSVNAITLCSSRCVARYVGAE